MVNELRPDNTPDNDSFSSDSAGAYSYHDGPNQKQQSVNELAHNELNRTQPGLANHSLDRSPNPLMTTLAPAQPTTPARSALRRERTDGITILALYHFGLGLLNMLGALLIAIPTVITGIVGAVGEPSLFWITGILGVATFFFMGLSLMYFLIGIGLWRLKQWSRIAAMALAVISLPSGLGTIPGALTLWYLLKEKVSALFR